MWFHFGCRETSVSWIFSLASIVIKKTQTLRLIIEYFNSSLKTEMVYKFLDRHFLLWILRHKKLCLFGLWFFLLFCFGFKTQKLNNHTPSFVFSIWLKTKQSKKEGTLHGLPNSISYFYPHSFQYLLPLWTELQVIAVKCYLVKIGHPSTIQ